MTARHCLAVLRIVAIALLLSGRFAAAVLFRGLVS